MSDLMVVGRSRRDGATRLAPAPPLPSPDAPSLDPVRRWVPETLGVCAAAGACGVLLWPQGPVVVTPVATGVLWYAEVMALPVYERRRSLRPVSRAGAYGCAVLLSLSALGLVGTLEVRWALLTIATVLAMPLLVLLVARLRPTSRRTLLVGDQAAVRHLIAQWGDSSDVVLEGVFLAEVGGVSELPPEIGGVPVVGRFADAAEYARAKRVDQLVVTPGPVSAYDVRRLGWALENSSVELVVAAEAHGVAPRRISPWLLGRRLVLTIRPARRPPGVVFVKAVGDRVTAAVLLTLLSPLLVALSVLVRWDSAGAALFRQVRAGKRGQPFTMFKFRTMSVDAERRRSDLEALNEAAGPLFKLRNDPRITRLGSFLRRTSLDELPQLWNVLRGEMSLIGPRPALLTEMAQYDDWVRRRLTVKPGMTGLWQVGGRSTLSWDQSVRLDLDYVDNWTLGEDLSIAGRTVRAVLRRDGAL